MKKLSAILSLLTLYSIPSAGAASALPPSLQEFLGKPPAKFDQKYLKPAKALKVALEHLRANRGEQAINELSRLAEGSEMAEHAGFALTNALREKKNFAKSSAQAEKVLREFPGSTYGDRLRELLDDNECDLGLAESLQARTPAKRESAARHLQRCLARLPWKQWADHEDYANALYEVLKEGKDPLFGPFVTEALQALPANTKLRFRLAREIPNDELEKLATAARFRTRTPTPTGVKPVFPDQELFDSGMKAVGKEDWSEANALFKRLPTEFPQSEHLDRAQYWIARTEEKLGHLEEAQKRCEQIATDTPLTYYGLQCALRGKRDLSALLSAPTPAFLPLASPPPTKFLGSPLTRQAVSLWRLRALLELGLTDFAREEAKFLFQLKPGGSTLGQEEPEGAVRMAELFQAAGYHLATFSHAYAAISLDPALFHSATLDLVFPHVFPKEFQSAADATGVNPLLLYSVAKQESAFIPNAVSRSDAFGLMQLLFPTAQEVNPGVAKPQLFEPAVNTQAGAKYLQKLLERFQGNIALALAGYNAGPTRAAQWQKEFLELPVMKKGLEVDILVDLIPFTETRKYVGNILRNFAWYKLMAKDGTLSSVQELAFQWQKTKEKTESPVTQPQLTVKP